MTTSAERTAADLDRAIESYINSSDHSDLEFERLALELFAYQYANNAPYRALCDQQGRGPSGARTWRDVPAVSAASFADVRLACFPLERTQLRFVSSGTTRAGARPSNHELENARLYDASLLGNFHRWVLPDREKIRMLLLSPPFEHAPHSSLAYMLSKLFATFADGGGSFIRDDALDIAGIARAAAESTRPVLVFGTAFAFVHLLEACAASGQRFPLPAGSRIVETGGFKGKSRAVGRDELYASLVALFEVREDHCIAEYGMCELGSQWYDAALGDALAGATPRKLLKVGPHWTRTRVVDPVTAEELPAGSRGLLQCFDLSNRGSVAAVLTGDLVVGRDEGFVWVARSPAAPPKGCSITVDSMLHTHG